MSADVVPITQRAQRGLIEGLQELLAKAEAGELTGITFVVRKAQPKDRGFMGLYGSYAVDTAPVVFDLARLQESVTELLDAREADRKASKPRVIPFAFRRGWAGR